MTREKRKTKDNSSAKGSQGKKEEEGYRPFAALKGMTVRAEKETAVPTAKSAERAPLEHALLRAPLPTGDDDAQALQRMINGVTPLASKARRIPLSERALPSGGIDVRRALLSVPALEEEQSAQAHLRALVEGGRFEVEDDGDRVEGRRDGVPPDVLRKLRRGLFPIDARLDLHGLRREDAEAALERFLREKRARGERCLLVVHGKGQHSPGGLGVLRGEIAAWLSQGRTSVYVSAFATAGREDGGEGAVYVLLVR